MARALSSELTPAQIQGIAEELEVGSPIMAYKVVGDRIELHLLGGGIAVYDTAGPPGVEEGNPELDLFLDLVSSRNVQRLRKAASRLEIHGYSSMNKKDIIAALASRAMEDPTAVNTALQDDDIESI